MERCQEWAEGRHGGGIGIDLEVVVVGGVLWWWRVLLKASRPWIHGVTLWRLRRGKWKEGIAATCERSVTLWRPKG
jgi:hypothetical protein